jgi:hypothetical protein
MKENQSTLFRLEASPNPAHEKIKDTCRHCTHRVTYRLNEFSEKILQCCELKKGRNNAGYKTIKVTDAACVMFKKQLTVNTYNNERLQNKV